ncbi:MAG: Ig-like domain-containing protein [Patescibacteria group bacterium]|nr:Ig-like domain-containing protein [Patescibacteria group bacterium]
MYPPTSYAQVINPTSPLYSYVESPSINSIIFGQREFTILLTGENVPYVATVGLDLVSTSGSGTVYPLDIIDAYHETQSNYRWHVKGDTLPVPNGTYSIFVHAYDSSGTAFTVLNSNGQDPIFGPYQLRNHFLITSPQPNQSFSTSMSLGAQITGAAQRVEFLLFSSANTSRPVLQVEDTSADSTLADGITTWSATMDVSTIAAGTYYLHLNVLSLKGTLLGGVASIQLSITHPCTGTWQCAGWGDCINDYHTRTCTDPNVPACLPTSTMPATRETCCEPNIQCSTWSGNCTNGIELCATYVDTNNCGTEIDVSGLNFSRTCTETPDEPAYIPPTGTVVAPADQTEVAGSVVLVTEVTGTVSKVEYYRDLVNSDAASQTGVYIGNAKQLRTQPERWEYSWDTAGVPDGDYRIFSLIYDTTAHYVSTNSIIIKIRHPESTPDDTEPSAPDETEPSTPASSDTNATSEPQTLPPSTTDTTPSTNAATPASSDTNTTSEPQTQPPSTTDTTPSTNTNTDTADANTNQSSDVPEDQTGQQVLKAVERPGGQVLAVRFEEPTTSGKLVPKKLIVQKVENFSPKIGKNYIVFRGIGPKNSYVTLYIYSQPLVVTTKTDEFGNFSYTLDKNLLDGEHEVYVTITDNTGKIKEKSAPLSFFVKRAQAVTEEEYLRGDVNVDSTRTSILSNYIVIVGAVVVVAILGVIGLFYISKRTKHA